ncbi:DUF3800 domain-containing protein, partial [Methanoregula sp.]|uniref:DUF3800 domain-containing protein n=1 Tax=Methanoregula sp. TaxID=2052170 RepID=UPI002375987B
FSGDLKARLFRIQMKEIANKMIVCNIHRFLQFLFIEVFYRAIIDKSLNGIRQLDFNQTLLARSFDRFNRFPSLEVKIFHHNSKTEYGIQIADIVAGTVYRHYTKYGCKPYVEGNHFPKLCDKMKIALDFFKGRRI